MEAGANRLIDEKSPYLLQHAMNPVQWYPWGQEAFLRARQEDKPVFLSIGYSTCHWCHVMAHESFEDPETAEILNRWFVSIKVDREERPDIDQMYMAATQAMTGSGGWPMSVFLLPDGKPFYAGTYFPPRPLHQKPGFTDLLTAIHRAWQQQREQLQETAQRLTASLTEMGGSSKAGAVQPEAADECFQQFAGDYDPREGGFGQAPKFPRPAVFTFLLHYYRSAGIEQARQMVLHSLDKMAAGGIYDHLGGGFHRYSVDERWFVPHFEKMLYDQAQLASVYLDVYQLSGEERFARVAQETFDYLRRDMRDPGGAFYSAEDADSDNPYAPGEHGEGAFYLWTRDDIDQQLGSQDGELFSFVYGAEPSGNVSQDPLGEFTGRNILSRARSNAAAAERFGPTAEVLQKRLAAARATLLAARSGRTRPHLDDKIITAWNGLLIGALAKGSRILQDPDLLDAALQAAKFIKEKLRDESTGLLLRRHRQQESACVGQLDDYVFLVDGLIELHQASHDPQWLRWACELTENQIELFWNSAGGYFYDSAEDPSLMVRMRSMYDGAEPAGNSVAAHNLLRLGRLRDNPQWLSMARELIASFSAAIKHYPAALPLMLVAWQLSQAAPAQLVIAGRPGAGDTLALQRAAASSFVPGLLVLLADAGENQRYLAEKLAFIESIGPKQGKATAYVCVDFSCRQPVTDPAELAEVLARF